MKATGERPDGVGRGEVAPPAMRFPARTECRTATVGFKDAVTAPLKRGRNEVVVVVRENYGGWAAAADFADPAGLSGLGG